MKETKPPVITTDENSEKPPTVEITAACEAGLAAVNLVDSGATTTPTLSQVADTTIDFQRDGVDITMPFFRDVLSDKPVAGANEIGSISDWSGRAAAGAEDSRRAAGDLTWTGERPKAFGCLLESERTALERGVDGSPARLTPAEMVKYVDEYFDRTIFLTYLYTQSLTTTAEEKKPQPMSTTMAVDFLVKHFS
ncbi:hypothetical protein C8J57DRAFT_1467796 [Mycena rebaudengoi]|nr:hypothetical protein C8J57DRAFT_1467796 [Mycena rebaudengoi]